MNKSKTILGRMTAILLAFSAAAVLTFGACTNPAIPAADAPVSELDLKGKVAAPVTGGTPVTTEIDAAQYTGTVAWKKGEADHSGNFAASTVYKAVLTLTAKAGFTFTGVAENSFKYDGAESVTNGANTGTVTITFKATAANTGDGTGDGDDQPVPVTSVTLSPTTLALTAGNSSAPLTIAFEPTDATDKTVTWTSSNTDVATVDTNGVVTAKAGGTATITVTAAGGASATCTVTVFQPVPVTGVTLNHATLVLTVGGATGTLEAAIAPNNATDKTVSWESSNTSVATVSNGVVTAVAGGTATITVTAAGGASATCTVTVTPAAGERDVHTLNTTINIPFRYVPAGKFQRDNTSGNITVISKGYWMGETEVTQELFDAVMGGGHTNGFPGDAANNETQEQRPVEQVSWYDAIAFCNKLSLLNDKDPVYSVKGVTDWASLAYSDIPTSTNSPWNANATMDRTKNGYRLPTDAEWMWAAMGADTTSQPNTTGYSKDFAGSTGTNNINDYAWHSGNAGSKTHQVGKKRANELGIHDMSGNVWEWCWDGSNGVGTGELTDPAASYADRVLGGGSWNYDATRCKVASRSNFFPYRKNDSVGFRVVCNGN